MAATINIIPSPEERKPVFNAKLEIVKNDENYTIEIRVDSAQAKELIAILLEKYPEKHLISEISENEEARIIITGKTEDMGHGNKSEIVTLLTDREHEIMENLINGKLNKEIAIQLEVSVNTVRKHLQNIFLKLKVDTRSEAIIQYLKKSGRLKVVRLLPDQISA